MGGVDGMEWMEGRNGMNGVDGVDGMDGMDEMEWDGMGALVVVGWRRLHCRWRVGRWQ